MKIKSGCPIPPPRTVTGGAGGDLSVRYNTGNDYTTILSNGNGQIRVNTTNVGVGGKGAPYTVVPTYAVTPVVSPEDQDGITITVLLKNFVEKTGDAAHNVTVGIENIVHNVADSVKKWVANLS